MRHFILCALLFWSGWVAADSATVADSVRANLRSGKTESHRIIRTLPPQTLVEMLLVEQEHAKVRTGDGEVGWLPLRMLNIRESSTDVTPAALPEQNVLAATQLALQATHNRLTMLQSELDQERSDARTKAIMATLVGVVALLFGIMLGIFLHEIYYRKRLNGLRI